MTDYVKKPDIYKAYLVPEIKLEDSPLKDWDEEAVELIKKHILEPSIDRDGFWEYTIHASYIRVGEMRPSADTARHGKYVLIYPDDTIKVVSGVSLTQQYERITQ